MVITNKVFDSTCWLMFVPKSKRSQAHCYPQNSMVQSRPPYRRGITTTGYTYKHASEQEKKGITLALTFVEYTKLGLEQIATSLQTSISPRYARCSKAGRENPPRVEGLSGQCLNTKEAGGHHSTTFLLGRSTSRLWRHFLRETCYSQKQLVTEQAVCSSSHEI
ncbi:hypothetical protein MGG_16802 [Pyricularia oryzae 70-15]|uniref:Uncharacterized protein n=3 Tax=Pyricularia oryzae TaxID=318829 RepID=G4N1U4_PYRO7|nr:uncharacterized protein MGG_16802 [Pyricularia oryzae 70-15]EHA52459.1 hypothetical protein MGG_16802 [Pyricularia oryzae 70-15]ELQ39231.1 hypothetical protein OOU_Y34scaffold00511g21 [Pyricularia oryzae Y34]